MALFGSLARCRLRLPSPPHGSKRPLSRASLPFRSVRGNLLSLLVGDLHPALGVLSLTTHSHRASSSVSSHRWAENSRSKTKGVSPTISLICQKSSRHSRLRLVICSLSVAYK